MDPGLQGDSCPSDPPLDLEESQVESPTSYLNLLGITSTGEKSEMKVDQIKSVSLYLNDSACCHLTVKDPNAAWGSTLALVEVAVMIHV